MHDVKLGKWANPPTVVSLFSGCGGLDLGFHELGYDLVYACDNDPSAIQVYQKNIDKRAYVRDVTTEQFHADINSLGNCDVVLGGFPCQGFSKAGPKNRNDSRNFLYIEMKKAIETLRPKIFVAENVDGLSQNFKGAYLEQITSDFRSIGYTVEYRLLDAANFGVPQHRRRIFFVGTRGDTPRQAFKWPEPTHIFDERNGESSLNSQPDLLTSPLGFMPTRAKSVKEAIGDISDTIGILPDHAYSDKWPDEYWKIIEKIGPGQKLCNVRFSPTSVYTWEIPEVFGVVDREDIEILESIGKNRRHKRYGNIPNGNPLPESEIMRLTGRLDIKNRLMKLVNQGYLKEKNDGYDLKGAMFCSGLFKRPRWDSPSPTVLTNFGNPRYFIHPKQNRPLTLRECARLQGFPDDFVFLSSMNRKALVDGYRLVGNAVSPPMSRVFATSVLALFPLHERLSA